LTDEPHDGYKSDVPKEIPKLAEAIADGISLRKLSKLTPDRSFKKVNGQEVELSISSHSLD